MSSARVLQGEARVHGSVALAVPTWSPTLHRRAIITCSMVDEMPMPVQDYVYAIEQEFGEEEEAQRIV